MSQHKTPPPDDHVSAYLDGELPAEEHARIEQLIAADDRYRQLARDLRQLRARLQSLPSYRLPGDLSDRILRQAERESLQPAAPVTKSITSRRWSSRFLGAAAAIAAALMSMFFWQRNPDLTNRELARLDQSPQAETAPEALAAPSPENPEHKQRFGDASVQSIEKSSVGSSDAVLVRGEPDSELGTALSAGVPRDADTAASALSAETVELSAETGEMSDKFRPESSSRVATRSPRPGFESLSEGVELQQPDALEPTEELDGQFRDEVFSLVDFGTSPVPEVIVMVDVPRESMRQRRLDESLVRQDIRFGELDELPPGGSAESNEGWNAGNRPLQRRVADAPRVDELLDEVGLARSDKGGDGEDGDDRKAVVAKNNEQPLTDLVYVRATRAQIDATLRDLRQRPDAFLRVTLRVADWGRQQPTPGGKLDNEEFEADLSDDAGPAFRKTYRSEDRNARLAAGGAPGEAASAEEHGKPRASGLAKRLSSARFRLRNAPDSDQPVAALPKDGAQPEAFFERIGADHDGRLEANRYRAFASRKEAEPLPGSDVDPDRMIHVLFLVRAVEQE